MLTSLDFLLIRGIRFFGTSAIVFIRISAACNPATRNSKSCSRDKQEEGQEQGEQQTAQALSRVPRIPYVNYLQLTKVTPISHTWDKNRNIFT